MSGASGNDNLTGNDSDNVLAGNDGDDTLSGGAGDDRLIGGVGVDVLLGGEGNDVLDARGELSVLDRLSGGDGVDTLLVEDQQDLTGAVISGIEEIKGSGTVYLTLDQLSGIKQVSDSAFSRLETTKTSSFLSLWFWLRALKFCCHNLMLNLALIEVL